MSSVFISYKSDEFDEACWVKTQIENEGISCWMAPMSIHGGSSYAEEIPRAIRECSVFVLILSEKVQESKWVPRELDQAINNNKLILPFMIENCELKDDFDFYLSNVQRYEAFRNKDKALASLIDEIKRILNIDVGNSGNETPVVDVDTTASSDDEAQQDKTEDKKPAPEGVKIKKKKNKTEKKTGKAGGKKGKKLLFALIAVVLTVVVIVSAVSIYDVTNTVWICDQEFKKTDSYLSFEGVQITSEDISSMEELEEISSIDFKKCHLKGIDLNRIIKLVSHRVTFDGCSLKNEDIANLNVKNEDIYELVFDNNPELTDLSVLKTYSSSLGILSFDNCGVADLSFVNTFGNLVTLSAINNGITDVSALSYCVNLENLYLSKNKISNLDSVKILTNLKILDISSNQLVDLKALEGMIYLSELHASGNKIKELSGLKNVTQLGVVDLSNNEISDVSILAKSSLKLKSINISNNKISDISSLAVCNFLTEFVADNNELTDISALKNCAELNTVTVSNNKITDVSSLSKCLKITHLDLSDNAITSVDSLVFSSDGFEYSVYLDLSNNAIKAINIAPFECSDLIIYGNEISDLSFLSGFESIGNLVFDYNEKINFESLKGIYVSSYYVLNCPLDKQVYVSTTLGTYSVKFALDDSI